MQFDMPRKTSRTANAFAEGTLSEELRSLYFGHCLCEGATIAKLAPAALSCSELVRTKVAEVRRTLLRHTSARFHATRRRNNRRTKLECVHSPFLSRGYCGPPESSTTGNVVRSVAVGSLYASRNGVCVARASQSPGRPPTPAPVTAAMFASVCIIARCVLI